MIPLPLLHAYVSMLSTWFWGSNALALVAAFSVRTAPSGKYNWYWLLVAVVLLIIAIGNGLLLDQALLLVAKLPVHDQLVALKLPTIVSSLLWGGVGVSLVSAWLTQPPAPNNSIQRTLTR